MYFWIFCLSWCAASLQSLQQSPPAQAAPPAFLSGAAGSSPSANSSRAAETVPAGPTTLDKAAGLTGLTMDQFLTSTGELKVAITRQSVKLSNSRDGMTLVFGPPYKEVLAYNNKLKKVFYCPIKKFESPYSMGRLTLEEVNLTDIELSAKESTVYQGLSALHCGFSQSFEAIQRQRFEHNIATKQSPRTAEMVSASMLNTDPRLVRFVDCVYSLPPTLGLPLDFKYVTFTAGKKFFLSTHHVQKANLQSNDFVVPPNYVKVSDFNALNFDENSRAGIDFMTGH